jgi:hypothetical protein
LGLQGLPKSECRVASPTHSSVLGGCRRSSLSSSRPPPSSLYCREQWPLLRGCQSAIYALPQPSVCLRGAQFALTVPQVRDIYLHIWTTCSALAMCLLTTHPTPFFVATKEGSSSCCFNGDLLNVLLGTCDPLVGMLTNALYAFLGIVPNLFFLYYGMNLYCQSATFQALARAIFNVSLAVTLAGVFALHLVSPPFPLLPFSFPYLRLRGGQEID